MHMQHPALSHVLVATQFVGIILACYPVDLNNRGPAVALALCALGVALGLVTLGYNRIGNFSVYPEPKAGAKLVTSGPYRYIRHPMYSALILMMIGIALYNFHPLNLAGVILVIAAVAGKAAIEERLLLARFAAYADYRTRSKRFVPGLY